MIFQYELVIKTNKKFKFVVISQAVSKQNFPVCKLRNFLCTDEVQFRIEDYKM